MLVHKKGHVSVTSELDYPEIPRHSVAVTFCLRAATTQVGPIDIVFAAERRQNPVPESLYS
jgi:hypothetical protein